LPSGARANGGESLPPADSQEVRLWETCRSRETAFHRTGTPRWHRPSGRGASDEGALHICGLRSGSRRSRGLRQCLHGNLNREPYPFLGLFGRGLTGVSQTPNSAWRFASQARCRVRGFGVHTTGGCAAVQRRVKPLNTGCGLHYDGCVDASRGAPLARCRMRHAVAQSTPAPPDLGIHGRSAWKV
jgi:hypothetical protein